MVKHLSSLLMIIFGNDLKEEVSAFKYAQYFDPTKINELKPTSNDIGNLRVIPFLDTNTIINGLKTELAYYMAKANGLSLNVDKLDWWKQHETELPHLQQQKEYFPF